MKHVRKHSQAVILFGKCPRIGFVKTRLAATIGHDKATEFYKICLSRIFMDAQKITNTCDVFFYFAEAEDGDQVANITPLSFTRMAQQKDSLTNRINCAFKEVFEYGYDSVCIFSTDTPELTSDVLSAAVNNLQSTDFVIGPDSDGGYYCLGMNAYYPDVLDVTYGSSVGMFQQTLDTVRQSRISYKIMQQISDVDTIDDLIQFKNKNFILWHKYYKDILPSFE